MNTINIIVPYKHLGIWVFDDPLVGLAQEPFVDGADVMIDHIVKDRPNAEHGFILIFSASFFPGCQYNLEWRRKDNEGNWYYSPELDMEGWLCPSLFRYFDKAPKKLYVQVKPSYG